MLIGLPLSWSAMAHIFISYAREDKDLAQGLADLLDSEGFDVWWDAEIYIGQEFPDIIKEAIDDARYVVVLWSKRSIKSNWVLREARRGYGRGKLLPVNMDGLSWKELPKEFGHIHTIEFQGWAPLLRELHRRTGVSGYAWPSYAVQAPMRHARRHFTAALLTTALLLIVGAALFHSCLRSKPEPDVASPAGEQTVPDLPEKKPSTPNLGLKSGEKDIPPPMQSRETPLEGVQP